MQITNDNIDDLIFSNKRLQKLLPEELKPSFDQWLMGKRVPALRFLSQKSQLELLDKLNTPNNIAILEGYFKEKVSIKPIDYRTVKHHTVPLEELDAFLRDMGGFANNCVISRDDRYAYLVFWR